MSVVANRMREAMYERSMNQSDIVRLTGISKSSISTYLSGDYEPKQRNLHKIAGALGVSEAWLMGNEEVMDGYYSPPAPGKQKKPRLGTIACGLPLLAQENFEGYDDVPEQIKCDFTLLCRGDSMVNARILDGDIVYIRSQPQVENGEIAAVLVGNEATLKRVYVSENQVILKAANPAYPSLVYTDEALEQITIIGKAVGFTSMF